MNGSCVSFRQRHPYDRAYVQIAKSTCAEGHSTAGVSCECSSNVGMVTARGTVGVSRTFLSSNCTNIGSILHELGHVLGRYHEHSRIDRDNYVEILYHNIYAYAISNFFIYLDTNTPIAYDYNSIMHYDSRAYSINGLATIRPLNTTTPLAHMGQRLYLTELDFANINFMYNCSHPSVTTHPSSVPPNVTLISPTTTHVTPNLPDTTFGTPRRCCDFVTQGLVLTSQPQAHLTQITTHPCGVAYCTPVYTQTPTAGVLWTASQPNRTSVYSLNSQCICHICMYKVLLYLFIVFLY